MLIGRGPSVSQGCASFPETDVVVKLKRGMCGSDTVVPVRCDFLFTNHNDELTNPERRRETLESVERCGCKLWVFDSDERRPAQDIRLLGARAIPLHIARAHARENGFPVLGKGKMTTGLMAILECIRLYKTPVYIYGFDALLSGVPSPDFDKPSNMFHTGFHNLPKETAILRSLIERGLVEVVRRKCPP